MAQIINCVNTRCLTCAGDEDFGPAAGEAVQQGLGSDVEVEQSSRAAQLGQTEPSPHEAGLVGQEQRDGVPFLQPGFSLQSSAHFVALPVHILVGVFASFKVQEGLGGMPLHRIQEAVQDAVDGFPPPVFEQPQAQSEAPQDVHAVRLEVRTKSLHVGQRQDDQPGENSEPHGHFCNRAQRAGRSGTQPLYL